MGCLQWYNAGVWTNPWKVTSIWTRLGRSEIWREYLKDERRRPIFTQIRVLLMNGLLIGWLFFSFNLNKHKYNIYTFYAMQPFPFGVKTVPWILWGFCCSILSLLCIVFCEMSFWPWCCLFLLDKRMLIVHLLSSIFSLSYCNPEKYRICKPSQKYETAIKI